MKTSRQEDAPRVKQSLMLLSSRERRGGNSLNSLVVSVVSVALDRKFRSFERRKILASALFVSMIPSNSVDEKKKNSEERETVSELKQMSRLPRVSIQSCFCSEDGVREEATAASSGTG